MQKAHGRINWENYPSQKTAVNEDNLNKMDAALDEIDNRVITIDLTKFDKVSANGLMTGFELNTETGDITLTYYSGSTKVIHTNFAKIALNISYDHVNEHLVLHMPDGTETYVDMSTLITQFEFLESDTITFEVTADGKVKANIKPNSITGDMLQPNYLADITVQAEIATQKAGEASDSADAALLSQQAAEASEQAAKDSETISIQKANEALLSASAASESESAALEYKQESALSQQAAAASEQEAKASENIATQKAVEAAVSASAAEESKSTAVTKASEALTQANRAQTEADRAAQYSSIVAPGFYVDMDSMSLYMKTGVGVDFIVADGNKLCWKIA